MRKTLIVDSGGVRLDRFLASRLEGYSRAYCKDLITRGRATVDGVRRSADYRLSGGEVVRLTPGMSSWSDADFESWVIREDKDILVLHKPAGILTHPMGESWLRHPEAALADSAANLAGLLIKNRPGISAAGVSRCGIVHRLDRQTSGVWVVAKTTLAVEALLDAFRERRVNKVYRAIVLGTPGKAVVEAPVGRATARRRVQVTPWGKEARTDFKTVKTARCLSLVEARPRTGRTHQIRAHLAHLMHPVVGDPEWFREPEREVLSQAGLAAPARMMLHAYQLRFVHPRTCEPVMFTAPMPADFQAYWKTLQP